jgi:hypothetical protein
VRRDRKGIFDLTFKACAYDSETSIVTIPLTIEDAICISKYFDFKDYLIMFSSNKGLDLELVLDAFINIENLDGTNAIIKLRVRDARNFF